MPTRARKRIAIPPAPSLEEISVPWEILEAGREAYRAGFRAGLKTGLKRLRQAKKPKKKTTGRG